MSYLTCKFINFKRKSLFILSVSFMPCFTVSAPSSALAPKGHLIAVNSLYFSLRCITVFTEVMLEFWRHALIHIQSLSYMSLCVSRSYWWLSTQQKEIVNRIVYAHWASNTLRFFLCGACTCYSFYLENLENSSPSMASSYSYLRLAQKSLLGEVLKSFFFSCNSSPIFAYL